VGWDCGFFPRVRYRRAIAMTRTPRLRSLEQDANFARQFDCRRY